MTNILDDSYEIDLTEEEHERLILMSEHAIAKPISPAAQAVLDACGTPTVDSPFRLVARGFAAAALRAAADQVVPPLDIKPQEDLESRREAMEWGMNSQTQLTRHQLLAIAAELEAQ